MKRNVQTSMPRSGAIVIFRPELIEFGGEERVILALSRKLHELKTTHSVVCYFDKIDLASFAELPLEVHQPLPKRNAFGKAIALRRCLDFLRAENSPVPVLFSIQSACHAGMLVRTPYHLWIPDTYSLLSESFSNARLFRSPVR